MMAAPGSLGLYIQFSDHMYKNGQGVVLARVLSLSDPHVLNRTLWEGDVFKQVLGKCISPLDEIIISHLLCVKALHVDNYLEAFKYQSECMTTVVKVLQNQRATNWMLPVMHATCLDLRLTAQKADSFTNSHGSILEQAAECLMNCFRVCAGDTESRHRYTKRLGLLNPVNHLLKIYFRLDKYNLCQSMIRAVEPAVLGGHFTIAQQVTFRYFQGRLAVLEGDFSSAEKHLQYAFRHCHPLCFKNKRTILTYLLPVKMILGFMPSKRLVEKYDLPMFWDLLSSVREGDLKTFERIVNANRRYFADSGLFSALESLRVLTYRNIFKKVYGALDSSRIPIVCFQAGLQVMSAEEFDASDTQCLIARMIYHNQIKAYMSYQRQMVVFSTENAFPRVSTSRYPG